MKNAQYILVPPTVANDKRENSQVMIMLENEVIPLVHPNKKEVMDIANKALFPYNCNLFNQHFIARSSVLELLEMFKYRGLMNFHYYKA